MGELSSEWGELGVPAPSDPGGVTQLEGTVGRQLRKASAILEGSLEPSCDRAKDGEESTWEVISGSTVSSPSLALLICVGASGCLFRKSLSASSACRLSQLTH